MKNLCVTLLAIVCSFNVFSQTQTTVRFKPDSTIGQDAVIRTSYNCISYGNTTPGEDQNGGNNSEIVSADWTYNSDGCPRGTSRSLLRFVELSTIPTTATIIRAELKLYGVSLGNNNISVGNSCYPGVPSLYGDNCPNKSFIQRVTSAWNEHAVTWNTQPTTTTVNQIIIPQSTTQWNWDFTDSSANLIAMVQDMVANPATNFGFMIKLETEAYYRSLLFASSDHPNPALHPELIVTYIDGCISDTTTFDAVICEGDTYSENGFNESKSGTYSLLLQNSGGCDSLLILNLTVEECCETQTITVQFKPDSAIGQDAIIWILQNSQIAYQNFGNELEFLAEDWTWNGSQGTIRSLLRFAELSTIPVNAVITRVELKLYGVSSSEPYPHGNSWYLGSPNGYFSNQSFLQKITSAWNEQTVTWNTQPTTDTTNQISIPQSTSQWNYHFTDSSANLLVMVQDWVSNPSINFGLMMILETEVRYRTLIFASSDHPNPALHPELIVTYELKKGEKKDTIELNETICNGEIYSENGFNDSVTGTYTHNFQNRFGCDSTVILNLYVAAKDTVSVFAEICDGETYSQNGFNESKSGTYYQNLQNIFGCDSLVELNLTVKQTPDIEIVALSDNFCDKDFVEIQLITNGDSFLWSTGSTENPITVTKSGIYSATAFIKDCEKTAEYTVEECPCELWLPNVFTPNNDGVNDDFIPVVRANLASFSMYIYDRWGQIIYKTDSYTPWDGTCNGRFASAGVYFCVISYSCADSPEKTVNKQGSVTLLR